MVLHSRSPIKRRIIFRKSLIHLTLFKKHLGKKLCRKMATKTFTLSAYTTLEVAACIDSPQCSVKINKKVFDRDLIVITLTVEEWKSLASNLPSFQATGKMIWDEIQAGTPITFRQNQKTLSDRYMVTLNAYTAPNNSTYVSTGIRQFYLNPTGEMRPKKEGGVNLSYEELTALHLCMDGINDTIATALSSLKIVQLFSIQDVIAVNKIVEDFYSMGHGKCRLILEKPCVQSE